LAGKRNNKAQLVVFIIALKMSEAADKPKIKLAVIGAGGSGKSCLVLRFVSDAFSE